LKDGLKHNLAMKIKTSKMANDWSLEEVEATVSDYFEMLAMELRDEPFNKAEHNRNLQKFLNGRTKGAIEKKHQNISAVLIELGYPYIDGYKPLGNYQELLHGVVEQLLAGAKKLQETAESAVEKPVETLPIVSDILSILVPPPVRDEKPPFLRETHRAPRKNFPRNYLEIEARNRSLGRAGEEFILRFEHERLWRAGKRTLAERIEHVAQTQNDSMGFDILSFEETGKERLIEVKTTRYGSLTPFFASRNEVKFSENREDAYQLYRLFHFSKQPQLFVLNGSLRQTCALEPSQFSALPR
jgi:hypothetical protein